MPMTPCHRCGRHLLAETSRCPFCAAPHRHGVAPLVGGRAVLLLGLALAACSDRSTNDDDAGKTTMDSSDTSGSSSGEGSSSTDPTINSEVVTYAAPSVEIELEALHGTAGETTGADDDEGTNDDER